MPPERQAGLGKKLHTEITSKGYLSLQPATLIPNKTVMLPGQIPAEYSKIRNQTREEGLTPWRSTSVTALTFGMTVTLQATPDHSSIFGFRARVLRAFGAKNASGSLGALVAYEQRRRVG